MQKISEDLVNRLSCKALGVLVKAEMMVKITGKESFQLADLLAWMPEKKTALYSALKELRGEREPLIEYTPARNGFPAEYRLAFQLSENPNACYTNKQTDLHTDQKKEKRSGEQQTGFRFSTADLQRVAGICQEFGFTDAFVMGILKERMTRFQESAPAFDVLRQRATYAITKASRNYIGYVRTIFLMSDFVEPEGVSSRQQQAPPPRKKEDLSKNQTPKKKPSSGGGDVWPSILQNLEKRINRPSFNAWLRPCKLVELNEQDAVIEAPDSTFEYWLKEHYPNVFQNAIRDVTGEQVSVRFEVTSP